jgi:hypothetical protein
MIQFKENKKGNINQLSREVMVVHLNCRVMPYFLVWVYSISTKALSV